MIVASVCLVLCLTHTGGESLFPTRLCKGLGRATSGLPFEGQAFLLKTGLPFEGQALIP